MQYNEYKFRFVYKSKISDNFLTHYTYIGDATFPTDTERENWELLSIDQFLFEFKGHKELLGYYLYTGDIIIGTYTYNGPYKPYEINFIGEIMYDSTRAYYYIKLPNITFLASPDNCLPLHNKHVILRSIIGNVHENKNLLPSGYNEIQALLTKYGYKND